MSEDIHERLPPVSLGTNILSSVIVACTFITGWLVVYLPDYLKAISGVCN